MNGVTLKLIWVQGTLPVIRLHRSDQRIALPVAKTSTVLLNQCFYSRGLGVHDKATDSRRGVAALRIEVIS